MNKLIVPPSAATPRPFLVCWDVLLASPEGQPMGAVSGDTFIQAFRMTAEQVLQIKQAVLEQTRPRLPEGVSPVGVAIRQIVELEG
jgi:hypothetical protein